MYHFDKSGEEVKLGTVKNNLHSNFQLIFVNQNIYI